MITGVDVFVCVTCQSGESRPGAALQRALETRGVHAHAVECLSVCKRPCTVAVSAPGKWTYIIGDLQETNSDELCTYINSYAASEYGTPPLRERPAAIRSGTIARIPPLIRNIA